MEKKEVPINLVPATEEDKKDPKVKLIHLSLFYYLAEALPNSTGFLSISYKEKP